MCIKYILNIQTLTIVFQCTPKISLRSTSNLLKLAVSSVEDVAVAAPRRVVVVLPERVEAPTSGNRAGGRSVTGEDERGLLAKSVAVSGASLPPVVGGVDQGVLAGGALVSLDKVGDPIDHCTGRKTVTSCSIGVIFDV